MFTRQTLFVIGAGASKEVGLPIGSELAEEIGSSLNFRWQEGIQLGDVELFRAIRERFANSDDLKRHVEAALQIHDGIALATSIDSYIYNHSHDDAIMLCGKLAIANRILAAERNSSLAISKHCARLSVGDYEKTWYFKFANHLFDGITKSSLDSVFEKVSIISFNYDRCIERFLIEALMSLWKIDEDHAFNLVKTLRIVRPYGSLGALASKSHPHGVHFGEDVLKSKLFEIAANIRTYTEQISDQHQSAEIREAVVNAKTIVFLGFSFQRQNLAVLKPLMPTDRKRIYGTALNLSNDSLAVIQRRLCELFNGESELRKDLTCAQFLYEYQHSLF